MIVVIVYAPNTPRCIPAHAVNPPEWILLHVAIQSLQTKQIVKRLVIGGGHIVAAVDKTERGGKNVTGVTVIAANSAPVAQELLVITATVKK